MNALALNMTTVEYREIAQTLVPSASEEFGAYLEKAKESVKGALKEERIKEDVRQVAQEAKDAAEDLKEAEKFGAKRKKVTRKKLDVFQAQTILPFSFKEQISQTLMGSAQVEQATRGLELSGQRPTKILKGLLDNLTGEGELWRLDRDSLPALGRVMLASGATTEKVNEVLAKLAKGPLTLDRVMKEVSQIESDLAMAQSLGEAEPIPTDLAAFLATNSDTNLAQGQLTVTAGGVGAMGQFFLSLGLSAEAVKAVTSDLAPGESFSSQSLRNLLANLEEPLAPCLSDGDLNSLFTALKSMGAKPDSLTLFSQFLAQTPQANIDDLIGFISVLENPAATTNQSANLAQDVQALISGAQREAEIAKTPVFNEIILKLSSLGDRELADNFSELSPALQALRGGISGMRSGGEGLGGQNQRGQDREKERLALSGLNSPTLNQGLEGTGFNNALSAATSELAGYGARESLGRQLEQKLIYSARQGVHRLKMDLDPESLGRLDVELKVKNDKLTAHIRAETVEAYEALEREISSLKASLAESGLEMNLTLSFEGQEEKDRHFARSEREGLLGNASSSQTEDNPEETTLVASQKRLFDKVI
ncbi:MAG: flagellar hook-length control protein FliK [Deltaproteobacteria bacterium]|jgi:hypothetical protein|nr:flagellar hook-length control protein FliK [Deltaproteobacteria bacterium]